MDAQHLMDLRLKRHISEYRFLESQWDEMSFAMKGFAESFQEEFHVDIALAAVRTTALTVPGGDIVLSAEPIPHSTNPSHLVRRLYRRLALVLHPDKPGGNSVAFLAVEQAYRAQDALKLLMIAVDAGISVDGMCTDDNDVSASMTLIRDRIFRIQMSIAWAWYNVSEAARPELRAMIVATLGKLQVPPA